MNPFLSIGLSGGETNEKIYFNHRRDRGDWHGNFENIGRGRLQPLFALS